jgi:hypothetical protein
MITFSCIELNYNSSAVFHSSIHCSKLRVLRIVNRMKEVLIQKAYKAQTKNSLFSK